jgi:hypothetical protein
VRVAVNEATSIAESGGIGSSANVSRFVVSLAFAVIVCSVVSVYPFNLNWRPNAFS